MARSFRYCPFCKKRLHRGMTDGARRLFCGNCGWIKYENPVPVAVCVAVNGEGEILITKRRYNPGKNAWALPGGFIEKGETPSQACLRELKEETDIDGRIEKLAGVYVHKTTEYGNILIIGYVVKAINGEVRVSDELKEARFVPAKNLPRIPFKSHREMIRQAINAGITEM
jgi:mutator protein MutT